MKLMKLLLDDREGWVLTEGLSKLIELNDFYSTDEDNNEDQFDIKLKRETENLYNKLLKIRGF